MAKYVYLFGAGKTEGSAKMKDLLGGKGANLAEMAALGIPVPPGFTITTEVCRYYNKNGGKYPEGLTEQVRQGMRFLEEATGRKFGDPENPLLVSVRSGAPVSMPGMMDTILNLGLNDKSVEGLASAAGTGGRDEFRNVRKAKFSDPFYLRKPNGKVFLRDGNDPAPRAMDHGDGCTPVALAGNEPVPKFVAHGLFPKALFRKPLHRSGKRFLPGCS